MRNFLKKVWEGIKYHFINFIKAAWFVILAVLIAIAVFYIFGFTAAMITGFSIVGGVILYVGLRQLWWFMWGSVDGDYAGRLGWVKRLIIKIFPKLKK